MQAQSLPTLCTSTGQAIPLIGMNIAAKIEGLATAIQVVQTYSNREAINIEAVYTFPLPRDAVLMSLRVQIGERSLQASIMEKTQAEKRYEDAISDGDTVVMLEQLESGLYTMNLGNLVAGETIAIELNYSFIQCWQGNQLRLFIPTTVAQRYGNHPFAPQQMPATDFAIEHSCEFKVQILGALARAKIASPSHAISVQSDSDCSWISLQHQSALLDRDFILTIESEQDHNQGYFSRDREGFCALASFHPEFAALTPTQSKNLKILVDCSGSMEGSSIQQARAAVSEIIASLGAGDFFNIILFGSHHQCIFKQMMPATASNIALAQVQIASIEANLGGTEIGSALQATYALRSEAAQDNDILLITDGEVWNSQEIFAQAAASQHRIFSVGVGSAVSENFVRTLAEKTGGAAELVSPNENMAERIVRHFQRMRAPRASKVEMQWSTAPSRQLDIGAVYTGDTLNIWAWFAKQPEANACLVLHMPDGSQLKQEIVLQRSSSDPQQFLNPLARLAAAARLSRSSDKAEITELACHYQLMSQHTNYLMVDVRAEKAEDLPELRKVPQMLAAATLDSAAMKARSAPPDLLMQKLACPVAPPLASGISSSEDSHFFGDTFQSTAKELTDWSWPGNAVPQPLTAIEFIQQLSSHAGQLDFAALNLALLANTGLPALGIERLQKLVELGYSEPQVALVFLYLLYQELGESIALNRDFTRGLAKAYKKLPLNADLEQALAPAQQSLEDYFARESVSWI